MHVHARAVLALQLFEGGFGVGIHRKCRRADTWLGTARGEAFNLANGHASAGDTASYGEASLRIVDGKEGASVAGGYAAFLEQVLDGLV